jgi:hypothetical protein
MHANLCILRKRAYIKIYIYYHASLNYVFQRKKERKYTNFLHKLEKTHIGFKFHFNEFFVRAKK